jgi:hypothetical protein
MPGKRVQFDQETWNALDLLARDSMRDFQELADEAFADLLRKHGRPVDLRGRLQELTSGEIHVCSEPAELRGSRQAVQALREAPTFLAGDIPTNGEVHRRPSAAGVLPGGGVAIDRRDPVSPRNACHRRK